MANSRHAVCACMLVAVAGCRSPCRARPGNAAGSTYITCLLQATSYTQTPDPHIHPAPLKRNHPKPPAINYQQSSTHRDVVLCSDLSDASKGNLHTVTTVACCSSQSPRLLTHLKFTPQQKHVEVCFLLNHFLPFCRTSCFAAPAWVLGSCIVEHTCAGCAPDVHRKHSLTVHLLPQVHCTPVRGY